MSYQKQITMSMHRDTWARIVKEAARLDASPGLVIAAAMDKYDEFDDAGDMDRLPRGTEVTEGPDVAAIKARLEAATPGPWTNERYRVFGGYGTRVANATGDTWASRADAEFIANAPSDIAALLQALEAAERRVAEAIDWFTNNHEAINGAICVAALHGSPYRGTEAPTWMQGGVQAALTKQEEPGC